MIIEDNDNAIIQEEEEQQQEEVVMMVTSRAATCEICIEPMSAENFFFNYNTDSNCNHPFCSDCISKYIRVQIEDENNVNIQCPAWKCKQILDPMICNSIISKQLFDKWCDGLCAAALPAELGQRCYCPYEDCKELIINECGGDKRNVNCPRCKNQLCFKCQLPWHKGSNCEQNQNNNLFLELARRKRWNRCPKCGYWVERVSGCSLIRCRCGACFCYRCGENHGYSPCRSQQSTWAECLQCALCPVYAILLLLIPYYYLLLCLFRICFLIFSLFSWACGCSSYLVFRRRLDYVLSA